MISEEKNVHIFLLFRSLMAYLTDFVFISLSVPTAVEFTLVKKKSKILTV